MFMTGLEVNTCVELRPTEVRSWMPMLDTSETSGERGTQFMEGR